MIPGLKWEKGKTAGIFLSNCWDLMQAPQAKRPIARALITHYNATVLLKYSRNNSVSRNIMVLNTLRCLAMMGIVVLKTGIAKTTDFLEC